jgi:uncharacterized protein (DUF2336 family)
MTKLLMLARDKSQGARNKLVENIKDLFLTDEGRLNEHERALMSDILSKLIASVEADLRQSLAETLATSGIDLPAVVLHLANDDAAIARPLLERSRLIQDQDLIAIVRMRTDEHRIAIAIREGVSADVSEALVEYGDEDVVETLLKNDDAEISVKAMEYLVAESRRVDKFQEPLINREELPSDLAYKMYWWVSAAMRKRIVTEFDVDEIVFDNVLQKATEEALAVKVDSDNTIAKAQQLVRRMHASEELTVDFLLQSLRQQRIPVFVAGIAELSKIDYETSWQVFSDKNCESLAIMARSIGVSKSDFTTMYLLLTKARDGSETRPTSELNTILKLFDSVTESNAKGALQFWQQNKSYQMAIEELEDTA